MLEAVKRGGLHATRRLDRVKEHDEEEDDARGGAVGPLDRVLAGRLLLPLSTVSNNRPSNPQNLWERGG